MWMELIPYSLCSHPPTKMWLSLLITTASLGGRERGDGDSKGFASMFPELNSKGIEFEEIHEPVKNNKTKFIIFYLSEQVWKTSFLGRQSGPLEMEEPGTNRLASLLAGPLAIWEASVRLLSLPEPCTRKASLAG